MNRYLQVLLVILVGAWAGIGVTANFMGNEVNFDVVAHVVGMKGVVDVAPIGRAIESPILIWIAWSIIPLANIVTTALCGTAAYKMLRSLDNLSEYAKAKELAILGCGVSLVMLFGGFVVAAELYFWYGTDEIGSSALDPAFRYIGSIGVIMLFLCLHDGLPRGVAIELQTTAATLNRGAQRELRMTDPEDELPGDYR